ncbi:hypothetical protein EMCRGX_G030011 [Ephydatia muelleri]|eukprot:Em0010g230a
MPTKQDVKVVKSCLPGVLNAQTYKSGDRLSGRPARSRIPNIHFEDVTVRSDYGLVTDQDDLAFAELVQAIEEYQPEVEAMKFTKFTCAINHAGQVVSMKALKWQKAIFVHFSEEKLSSVSKECLVSLLDFAEDTLQCNVAYAFFNKTLTVHEDFIRAMKFVGFELLVQPHPLLPLASHNYSFMAYELSDGDSSSDQE